MVESPAFCLPTRTPQVSGSGQLDSLETDRLRRLGLKFLSATSRRRRPRHAELVIYSSAIKKDNPILKERPGKRKENCAPR